MMNPGAQEIYDGVETAKPQAAPAQASDPIQEIQKYKQLFDAGVIACKQHIIMQDAKNKLDSWF